MRRLLARIAALAALLFLLDQLYRGLHPEVNLARACLVGASALALLVPLARPARRWIDPLRGALAIFASASGSVLLIESGVLVSRSLASGVAHVLILALAFLALERGIAFRSARRHGAARPWSATS
jgi:hypothetical protein